mmetsp:Transcript_16026/g.28072  ORF Transcript_16026/g.28072 Transcript_16026/m.28072 type:complete len:174 (-) Transcript_16026:681-1202(-)
MYGGGYWKKITLNFPTFKPVPSDEPSNSPLILREPETSEAVAGPSNFQPPPIAKEYSQHLDLSVGSSDIQVHPTKPSKGRKRKAEDIGRSSVRMVLEKARAAASSAMFKSSTVKTGNNDDKPPLITVIESDEENVNNQSSSPNPAKITATTFVDMFCTRSQGFDLIKATSRSR